ncbi:MAG: LrgB family protein [Pseudomonadales bacterium]|nr:LrgB family protein [Pseudomonadales bacterium]
MDEPSVALVALDSIISNPLFGVFITLLAFKFGQWCYKKSNQNPFFQPMIVGLLSVFLTLLVLGLSFDQYFATAQPLHLMLGPVTVALAVPLYENVQRIRAMLTPILMTVVLASVLTVSMTVVIAWLMGASQTTLLSLLTKSITTPIAMAVSTEIGGIPSLAAVFVIYTGIIGVIVGPSLLNKMRVTDKRIRGITMGISAHAIGTARAIEEDRETGAFSALAMGMTGFITAFVLPLIVMWCSY